MLVWRVYINVFKGKFDHCFLKNRDLNNLWNFVLVGANTAERQTSALVLCKLGRLIGS